MADTSLSDSLVVVFGGSGFLGKVLARALCARFARVRIAVRRPSHAGDLRLAGEVGQVHIVAADITNSKSVANALEGADAVVNLVGILCEKGAQTFDRIHGGGMKTIASLAAGRDIKTCVYVSALGADPDSESMYARSKAVAESVVLSHVSSAIILRPSIIFGPDDDFFNRFARMAKLSPALPLIGGGLTRFQPIHVEDVAEAICASLIQPSARGNVYELGGPTVYTFKRLMEMTLDEIGARRFLLSVPWAAALLMGKCMDVLAAPLPLSPVLTGDQVRLLRTDSVVTSRRGVVSDLIDTPLRSVEGNIGSYLWRYRPGGQYHDPSAASRSSEDRATSRSE